MNLCATSLIASSNTIARFSDKYKARALVAFILVLEFALTLPTLVAFGCFSCCNVKLLLVRYDCSENLPMAMPLMMMMMLLLLLLTFNIITALCGHGCGWL